MILVKELSNLDENQKYCLLLRAKFNIIAVLKSTLKIKINVKSLIFLFIVYVTFFEEYTWSIAHFIRWLCTEKVSDKWYDRETFSWKKKVFVKGFTTGNNIWKGQH